jgi:NAD(P)-dependent dehydrogenase (short-subunit alcohol dehydrogenase family)
MSAEINPTTFGNETALAGSVALVTGGGRGLGRMAALHLARAGAAVGIVARSPDELAMSLTLIEEHGGVAAAATADVTDRRAMTTAIEYLRGQLGPVDILVNNAGIVGPIGPTWEVDLDAWWRAMEVNVRGILIGTQLVLPDMVERRHGRVLNMTSQAGAYRWPMVSGYSVSKAAVVKLTENLARETSRYGISVFSVHPGLLPIGMSDAIIGDSRAEDSHETRIRDWVTRELSEGRGADTAAAMRLVMRLATGSADALSGRHISVHDDLDAMLERIEEVREHDLYVMRPERLQLMCDELACA